MNNKKEMAKYGLSSNVKIGKKVKYATSLQGPSGRRLSPVTVAWSD